MKETRSNCLLIPSTNIPMPPVKPPCKHRIEIRLASDNVYDVFVDGAWTFTRGSYLNVLTELEKIFTIFEPTT